MPKLVSVTGLNNLCASMDKNVYERVSSFNSQHCVTDNTKTIIVGTITPPKGTNNGYFYTAPRNNIYGYIDAARGTNLKELKNKLNGGNLTNLQKAQIVDEIKDVLRKQRIAFLDIMDKAVRKQNSHKDSDIAAYTLDKSTFQNIPQGAKIICNSRLAEAGFKQIQKDLGCNLSYKYLSQRSGKKMEWIAELQ